MNPRTSTGLDSESSAVDHSWLSLLLRDHCIKLIKIIYEEKVLFFFNYKSFSIYSIKSNKRLNFSRITYNQENFKNINQLKINVKNRVSEIK